LIDYYFFTKYFNHNIFWEQNSLENFTGT